MKRFMALSCILLPFWTTGCDSNSDSSTTKKLKVQVVGANDLGLHWIAKDYSVFAVLPPYNVVRAQVVRQAGAGLPEVLDDSTVELRYSAISALGAEPNSTSVAKTDFWDHAEDLFGVRLELGEGLRGFYMPADAPKPGPQTMEFDAKRNDWVVRGLPITPIDDEGGLDCYPLLRLTAFSKETHKKLAHLDVVVPVSDESECGRCHESGGVAAREPSSFPGVPPTVVWSQATDRDVQMKENILILHDLRNATHLYTSQPVLCADCHYVAALDFEGAGPTEKQCYRASLSRVVHQTHGYARDEFGELVFPETGAMADTCYSCHPGHDAQALRGAMRTGDLECVDCHGNLLAVGGAFRLRPGGSLDGKWDGSERRPWVDMPRCQSCHTGDALVRLTDPDALYSDDGMRLQQAYRMRDESASTFLAPNPRFAENPKTRYRDSLGHGGLACENCHGSTHTEWPNGRLRTSDNLAAYELQKHCGVLVECKTCHPGESLAVNVAGPHGLHNVGDPRFVQNHGSFFAADHALCKACHGVEFEGTVLSRAHAERSFELAPGRVVHLAKGRMVDCGFCHAKPPKATGLQACLPANGLVPKP
ncbi:MAG: hypothetical protein HZA52_11910 [Planctomycetes bacterium]|nr:hypothetical protein [Planctomycetota bacterium]